MITHSIRLLLLITCVGCSPQGTASKTWTYSEKKEFPEGISVAAEVTAEEWASDEPARTTRKYYVTADGRTDPIGSFGGEITGATRIGGVIVVTAYAEFGIRTADGAWSYVLVASTAELQRQGIHFAVEQAHLADQWRWMEIVGVDTNGRAVTLQDRKDKARFRITFDDTGRNLEFR